MSRRHNTIRDACEDPVAAEARSGNDRGNHDGGEKKRKKKKKKKKKKKRRRRRRKKKKKKKDSGVKRVVRGESTRHGRYEAVYTSVPRLLKPVHPRG